MFIFTVPSKFQKRHESSITEVICYSDVLFFILISYIEGSAEIAIMLVLLIIVLRLAMVEMGMQPLSAPLSLKLIHNILLSFEMIIFAVSIFSITISSYLISKLVIYHINADLV